MFGAAVHRLVEPRETFTRRQCWAACVHGHWVVEPQIQERTTSLAGAIGRCLELKHRRAPGAARALETKAPLVD